MNQVKIAKYAFHAVEILIIALMWYFVITLSGCTLYDDYKSLTPQERNEIRLKIVEKCTDIGHAAAELAKQLGPEVSKVYLSQKVEDGEITQAQADSYQSLAEKASTLTLDKKNK